MINPTTLLDEEAEILLQTKNNPQLFFQYFFKKEDSGLAYQFDYNFDDKGKWQEAMCMALEPFFMVVAGIATGKTSGIGNAAFFHCLCTRGFKFLNVAREAWQSQLMYTCVLEQLENTRAEDFVIERPRRPYPKLVIGYSFRGKIYRSSMEFMSIGESGDASNIFSWRGDWINIDEAGRIDGLGSVTSNLLTRLTGATADQRPYLGRMTMTTNAWDNPDLWVLADSAARDRQSVLLNVDTASNHNVTKAQLDMILKSSFIADEDRSRYLTGRRPSPRGSYFSADTIKKCESIELSRKLHDGIGKNLPGYVLETVPALGAVIYEIPREPGHVYFVFGDPGTGAPPARNAPVIMVFDVTDVTTRIPIVALWWGNGRGDISPFVDKLLDVIQRYAPTVCGIDSTATQKYTAQMLTNDYIRGNGFSIDAITPLDFSGGKRYAYLVSCRLSLEAGIFAWSSDALGITSQFQNYVAAQDNKLPQDLVATISMASATIRSYFPILAGQVDQGDEQKALQENIRRWRDPLGDRSRRSGSRSGKTLRFPR